MAINFIRQSPNIVRNLQAQKHYPIRCRQTTVDAPDVHRHSNKAEKWWDTNGPLKLLHALNDLRVPFIRDGLFNVSAAPIFSNCLKGKKILDVGCGGGLLTESLASLGAHVTGIDASKELIDVACYHSTTNKLLANNMPTYINTTIEEHSSMNSEMYDAVVASEIIEHVFEKELFVESCVRLTKPNGKLFFTTPNKTRMAQFYVIFINERILRNIPKDTHQYDKFMTPKELENMLQKNNCVVESSQGFVYKPISGKWKWTNNKLFFFALQAVKLK